VRDKIALLSDRVETVGFVIRHDFASKCGSAGQQRQHALDGAELSGIRSRIGVCFAGRKRSDQFAVAIWHLLRHPSTGRCQHPTDAGNFRWREVPPAICSGRRSPVLPERRCGVVFVGAVGAMGVPYVHVQNRAGNENRANNNLI